MGWVADSVELAVALGEWAKQRLQSSAWKKNLGKVSRELLLEDVDLRTAQETVKLAHEAGFAGPELDTVEERIAAIVKYEKERAGPPRMTATRMRRKPSAAGAKARKAKPSTASKRKKALAKKPAKKRTNKRTRK